MNPNDNDKVTDAQWWRSFHVIEMADLFLKRSEQKELDETCDFLRESLKLDSGSVVYDQCCGAGTLSFELAKHEIKTVGADLCQAYIDRAMETLEDQPCEFHCADAFEFVPELKCDGVFNWYSSFGYAQTNHQNQTMLARAFESLRPGRFFALDVPNFPGVIRGFQRHLVRTGRSQGREVTCIRESNFNLPAGRLEQTWSWLVEGRPVDRRKSSLRIYLPHEIREMLEAVGFEDIQLYGRMDRTPIEIDSPRLIAVARRPT